MIVEGFDTKAFDTKAFDVPQGPMNSVDDVKRVVERLRKYMWASAVVIRDAVAGMEIPEDGNPVDSAVALATELANGPVGQQVRDINDDYSYQAGLYDEFLSAHMSQHVNGLIDDLIQGSMRVLDPSGRVEFLESQMVFMERETTEKELTEQVGPAMAKVLLHERDQKLQEMAEEAAPNKLGRQHGWPKKNTDEPLLRQNHRTVYYMEKKQ